ncbi:non-ribosomal peptide synthetase, partial [Streptomyces sp. NPDC002044]|uniref:non-ribosomal peptide synthetase n=1 Tax=Streptomyces sp. NPDC002044 TaxID=3154662 RepID=UPI003317DFC8
WPRGSSARSRSTRTTPRPRPARSSSTSSWSSPPVPALISQDGEIGYAELWRRIAAAEEILAGRGIRAGDPVGLYFHRSADYVVALLAAFSLGAVAVPLDPEYPAERIDWMLAQARPRLVLRGRDTGHHPDEERSPGRWTTLRTRGACAPAASEGPVRTAREARTGPDGGDPAMILFTSGSTGRPKGVRLHHAGLVNRISWGRRQYAFHSGDRVLHKASVSFDASLHEIFAPLTVGGTLVIAPPGLQYDSLGLARLMQDARITAAHFVPSVLRYLLAEPELADCLDLRLLFCGGEALGTDLVRAFRRILPECLLFNQYGPTETSVNVSYWDAREGHDGPVAPIGRPVDGAELHVLAADLTPVPAGETGELWVGGVPVAHGYLDPARTAERFLPDPGVPPGSRRTLYRTGDLVRLHPAGYLEYHGRTDDQVKIRGVRVEPGEVAAALARHDGVLDALVVADPGPDSEPRLLAYVVPAAGATAREGAAGPSGSPLTAEDIRAWAARTLPPALRPDRTILLPELPRLANGKVDRAGLPRPCGRPAEPEETAGTATAERLREIWRRALGVGAVRDEDDFLSLGGHSLLALRIATRIRESTGLELPPGGLLRAPDFAGWLRAAGLNPTPREP